MELKETIEHAKVLAKNTYVNACIMNDCHNRRYKRKWNVHKLEDGRIGYALNGTPDKAFVFVSADKKEVTAVTQAGEVIKVFKVYKEMAD